MGKNILYIANYYLDDVIEQRNSAPYISQAGQNKSTYMIEMLRTGGNAVTIWSNAWTKSTGFHYYKGFQSKLDERVFYSDIFGAPFLNVYTCRKSCKRFIDQYEKKHHFDVIVFYNMRLEGAPVALYAKKKYGTKIVLQYEDGLVQDAGITGLKKWLYRRMEKKTMPKLDGAFLVNGKLKVPCPSVVVRGALVDQKPNRATATGHSPRLLFASTLDEQRGIGVLLEALAYTDEEFELQITGRGSLVEQVAKCKDPRVKVLGFLDYEEYKRVLQASDICINAQLAHGNFGNYSFPSKIYEYLSYHKLVVSSDVADAKEALRGIAFVYEKDSARELAKTIDEAIRVWSNPESRESYDIAITKYIHENSIHEIAKQANQMIMML